MSKGQGEGLAPVPALTSTQPQASTSSIASARNPAAAIAGDTIHTLWCLVEGDSTVFEVAASANASINRLKVLVREKKDKGSLRDVNAADLVLLKVNIDLNAHTKASLGHLKVEDSDEGVQELIEWKRVSHYWSASPANDRLHIFVKVPDAVSLKRRRSASEALVDTAPRKQPHLDTGSDFESLAALVNQADQLHQRIQGISIHPADYSDPTYVCTLPFPSINIVPERFAAESGSLEYFGREVFRTVWETCEEMERPTGYKKALYVYGTMGYGKSHILAALACLLIRRGHRVVYFPDCRAACDSWFHYLRRALLFAFRDNETQQKIMECGDAEQLLRICESFPDPLYIIYDQKNALDPEDPGEDEVSEDAKQAVRLALPRISFNRISITSASANYRSAMAMSRKQDGKRKIALLGGMTEVERFQWWLRHAEHFKNFTDLEKKRIEDLTGCIPLLLGPFLGHSGKSLADLEPEIWHAPPLWDVTTRTNTFAEAMYQKYSTSNPLVFQRQYLTLMRACLANTATASLPLKMLDHRYFYEDPAFGAIMRYTCGLARQSMFSFVRRHGQESFFLGGQWHQAMRAFKNNPSVIGFIVEQIVISTIASYGLELGDWSIPPTKVTTFEGNTAQLSPETAYTLYVPLDFNFKAIDSLFVALDHKTKVASVTGIQITIAKNHKDSEAQFFETLEMTTEPLRFEGFKVVPSFVWIHDGARGREQVEKAVRKLRSRAVLTTHEHTTYWVSLDQVDAVLAGVLSSIRNN